MVPLALPPIDPTPHVANRRMQIAPAASHFGVIEKWPRTWKCGGKRGADVRPHFEPAWMGLPPSVQSACMDSVR
jgi:hypothetical protein